MSKCLASVVSAAAKAAGMGLAAAALLLLAACGQKGALIAIKAPTSAAQSALPASSALANPTAAPR